MNEIFREMYLINKNLIFLQIGIVSMDIIIIG